MDQSRARAAVYKAAFAVIAYIILVNVLQMFLLMLFAFIAFGTGSPTSAYALSETLLLGIDIFVSVVALGGISYFMLRRAPTWEYQAPRPPFNSAALPLFLLVFAVSNIINTLGASVFERIGFVWESAAAVSDWGNTAVVVLAVIRYVFVPAAFEELFFRGAVLNTLAPAGERNAVILGSFLFAALHANPGYLPGIFMLGFVFSYITVKTRSLVPSTLLHLLNNSVALLSEYFASLENPTYLSTLSGALLGFGLVGITLTINLFSRPEIRAGAKLERGALPLWRALLNPCVLAVVAYVIFVIIITAVKV